MITSTCCFIGHHHLPLRDIPRIRQALDEAIDQMIALGVDTFISGGAPGFDRMAAAAVLAKRAEGRRIKLVLSLSGEGRGARSSEGDRQAYRALVDRADAVCRPPDCRPGCANARNDDMVARSGHLICYLTREQGATARTVRYARLCGLNVIQVNP